MSLFSQPVVRATDANNDVLSGAKWYFYATGGTTPASVYTNSTLTVAHANPVVADSSGLFAPIYLDPAVTYRAIQKTSTGSVIQDIDPIGDGLRSDLASDTGFTLVKHKSSKANTYARTGTAWTRVGGIDDRNIFNFIDPQFDDHILDHSNTTSLTAYLQNGFDSVGSSGGTLIFPNGAQFLCDTSLTVKANTTMKGPFAKVGSPKDNTSYPYDQLSAIILNSAATITLKGGAGIDGMLIQRKGITYPATVGSFAGTAITGGGDDYFVANSMILGFAQAIYSTLCQRPRITDVNIDCTAGVWLDQSMDIPRLRGVHCWPFTNVGTTPTSNAHRSGSAFKFVGCDWPHLDGCFSYSYLRGIENDGSDDLVAINHSIDGTAAYAGSKGISIVNDALRNRFIGLNVSSQDTGLYLNASASTINNAELVGSNIVTCAVACVSIDGGDLATSTTTLMGAPKGIVGTSSTSRIAIASTRFASIATRPIDVVAGTTLVLGANDYGDFVGNPINGATLPIVASATTLVLPNTGNAFQVSGTTAVTAINYGWAGREVALTATGAFTLTNGASLMLSGAANFAMTADDQVMLIHDGTKWREKGRSVN